MKQRIIEEKLERLGVERATGSGMSTVPHIHAPHARAASVRIKLLHCYISLTTARLTFSLSVSPSRDGDDGDTVDVRTLHWATQVKTGLLELDR